MTAPIALDRKVQVLAGLARGRDIPRIATDLGIGADAVRHTLERVAEEAGLPRNQAQLVDWGYRTGLLTALRPAPPPVGLLRLRELQVLRLVAAGMRDEDIARELWLSLNTIKTHVKRMLARLGAVGRAHAVAIGWQHGLLGVRVLAGVTA